MKRPDIVVLNDMHPSNSPGAATIAFIHAKFLSEEFAVEFWHTSTKRIPRRMDGKLKIRSFHRNQVLDDLIQKNMASRIFWEFFPSLLAIKILFGFLLKRPRIVWVNQIGIRVPKTLVIFLQILGIRTVQTFHDFGLVTPRKLYPSNLVGPGIAVLSSSRVIELIYRIRRRLLISLTRLNFANICISDMQAELLYQFGLRKIEIIPNGINPCKCKIGPEFTQTSKTILFAGRSIGKGFESTCRLVGNNPNWTLLAAGNADLERIASLYLDEKQFKYLGFLKPEDLFVEIHCADFVSVLSECFDVYPTIALEAFMHDTRVISSPTTGVSNLIRETNFGLVLETSVPNLNLDYLKSQLQTGKAFPKEKISVYLSGNLHKSLFASALSPA